MTCNVALKAAAAMLAISQVSPCILCAAILFVAVAVAFAAAVCSVSAVVCRSIHRLLMHSAPNPHMLQVCAFSCCAPGAVALRPVSSSASVGLKMQLNGAVDRRQVRE
jgi:hypothetical protein